MRSNARLLPRNPITTIADHRELDRLLRLVADLQTSRRPQLIEREADPPKKAGRIAARRRIKPRHL